MHLKSSWQDKAHIDLLLEAISKSGINPNQLIIFDLKPESAKYIKEKSPKLILAASVSHPYDIERYNTAVGGTLLSIGDFINNLDTYSWAWLDEWDLLDTDGGQKKFITEETVSILRNSNVKVALVSPELHKTSPALLGGESHEDGIDLDRLEARFIELASLKPEAICTDYPDRLREITIDLAE
jgi:hypothetical protein